MDSTLQGALVGAASTLGAAAIGYIALHKPSSKRTVVTVLPDRIAVFKKARDLIESAQLTVIDTTWGNSEENLLPVEENALNDYLAKKSLAKRDVKLDYREIYTESPDDAQRSDRIKAEQAANPRSSKYSAKLLDGICPSFPMIDFLVVDGKKTILSCLSKDVARTDHHHIYVESVELASFLTQYFQICWDRGRLLGQRGVAA